MWAQKMCMHTHACTYNIPISKTGKLKTMAMARQRTEGRTKLAKNLFVVHIVVTAVYIYYSGKGAKNQCKYNIR